MLNMLDVLKQDRFDENIKDATGTTTLTSDSFTRGPNGVEYVFTAATAQVLQLPAALPGYCLKVRVTGAGGVSITPASTENVSNPAGGYMTLPLASKGKGARVTLICNVAGYWDMYFSNGMWGIAEITRVTNGAFAMEATDVIGQTYVCSGTSALISAVLPAAVVGMKVGFVVGNAYGLSIAPNGTELIQGANGQMFNSTYPTKTLIAGSSVVYECRKTGEWTVITMSGGWNNDLSGQLTATLTAADLKGQTLYVTGADAKAITLPEAVAGMEVELVNMGTASAAISFLVTGTNGVSVVATGARGANSKGYDSLAVIGSRIRLKCRIAGTWSVVSYIGAWSITA